MLQQFIAQKITENLPFNPTQEQKDLVGRLSQFVCSCGSRNAFLLKGYAGTGKTSVVGALVKTMKDFERKTVLLAPTGRAAKVFSSYSGMSAFSIHKQIYRQKSASEFVFQLDRNVCSNTLFIVDEASMISTSVAEGRMFGTGNLLDDLMNYVFSNEGNGLLLLGDDAQLPPVMQQDSPAMERGRLEAYGLSVEEFQLRQVVRQADESGILFNATSLRTKILLKETAHYPVFDMGFADIGRLSGADLIESLAHAYDFEGVENTVVVTRSNKLANIYNRGIRNQVLQNEDEISNGDWLLVTKNNYFWSKRYKGLDFIANGDVAKIGRIRKYHELYGCRFADVSLLFDDYGMEIDVKILIDSFYVETAVDVEKLNRKLREAVMEDYSHITNKRDLYKALMENEYYNALQVKFAYAVTCHKAQGGQWKTVFVDQGYVADAQLGYDYYRWLYTAFTRAQKQLFLVNFSDKYFPDGGK